MEQRLKILMLEDSAADAVIIQRLLVKEKLNCEFRVAIDKATYLLALDYFYPSVILSDHSFSQLNSEDAFTMARQKFPGIPFIMITESVSEEFAADMIKMGVDDYIIKDRMARLPASIAAAVKRRKSEKEKQEAEQKIIQSEINLRAIFENTSEGFVLLDKDAIVMAFNKYAEGYVFFSGLKLFQIGQSIYDFIEESQKSFFREIIEEAKNGKNVRYYRSYEMANANTTWIDFSVTPVIEADQVKGICITVRDITKKKTIEQQREFDRAKLNEAIRDFQLLVSNVKDYAIFLLDKEGRVASWNIGAEHIKGYTADEIIGQPLDVFYTAEERQQGEPQRNLQATLELGHFETEGFRLRKDGSSFYASVVFTSLTDEEGKFYGYAKITKDITEKRKAEERIRFLASIADNIQDPVISSDDHFIINRWNDAAEKLFEWGNEEAIGKTTDEILRPAYPYQSAGQILESLKEKDFWHGEVIYHTKSGMPLNVLATVSHLKCAEGNKSVNLILARDITQRKKAETALSKLNVELEQRVKEQIEEVVNSEKRFRAMIENSIDFINVTDQSHKIIYRSPSAYRITGWTDEEIINEEGYKHIHPDDRERASQVIRDAEANPGKPIHAIMRALHKNGQYIWLEGVVTNLLHDENVKGFVSNYHDVTEREEEHKKLLASEVRYRRLFEAAKDGILILNADTGIIVDVNPFLITMLGYSHAEFMGKQLWEIGLFKDIVENKSEFQKLQKEQYTRYENLPLKTKDGQAIWVEFVSNVYDVDGTPVVQCNIRDITRRKQAERQIKESNERFELVVSATNDVIWDWDLATNRIWWNTNYYLYFGYDEKRTVPDVSSWQDNIHPDDKSRVISGMRSCIADKKPTWTDEYRFRKADGNFVFILDYGHIVYDMDDKPYRMVGAMLDITNRKNAEEEIKKSKERFQYATLATTDILWELNFETKEYLVHQSKGKLFSGNKVLNWQMWIDGEYIASQDRQRVKNSFNEAIKDPARELWEDEYRVNFTEDAITYVINHTIFIRDAEGKAIRAIGALTDITEKKNLIAELFDQQRKEHLKLIATALEAQEKERNAIGQELHDNVNQILSGTNLFLSMIKKRPEKTLEYIESSMKNIQAAIQENRKIAHTLVTPDVEEVLLRDLLFNLTNSMLEKSGIHVHVRLEHFHEELLNEELKLSIYRILQEQFTNIIKYSEAKLVNILISTVDGVLKMVIADDGKGMEPDKKADGIGIRNIKARLIVFDGNANIVTAPGKGFTLEVSIPLVKSE